MAQYPLAERAQSRLLHLDPMQETRRDLQFSDLPKLLEPGDLLVFNDTRVIPARLHARKPTGGRVEILIERVLNEHEALAMLRASKPPRPGIVLDLEGSTSGLCVLGREGEHYRLETTDDQAISDLLEAAGHMPLPPYIERCDEEIDQERYQTVYARQRGAVAAPTAGLHFDEPLLQALRERGVGLAFVTLHVGAGTFQPVRVDELSEHRMHSEMLCVHETTCRQIEQTRRHGRRVVAVGTTAVRALETASAGGRLRPYVGETRLFITPGYRFQVVDALITNFHMPETTLLMLVCAFAGRERMLAAYRHAITEAYRFYSYGDAMMIAAPDSEARP